MFAGDASTHHVTPFFLPSFLPSQLAAHLAPTLECALECTVAQLLQVSFKDRLLRISLTPSLLTLRVFLVLFGRWLLGAFLMVDVTGVVGSLQPRFHVFGLSMKIAELMESKGQRGKVHCSKAAKEAYFTSAFSFEASNPTASKSSDTIEGFFVTPRA